MTTTITVGRSVANFSNFVNLYNRPTPQTNFTGTKTVSKTVKKSSQPNKKLVSKFLSGKQTVSPSKPKLITPKKQTSNNIPSKLNQK
jgi:hypothetical protein